MVDITFQPTVDGLYTVQRVVSSLAPNVVEVASNPGPGEGIEAGVLINVGPTNAINKILKIPPGIYALELQVRYHTANRIVHVRIYNSVDDLNYETTPTQEFVIQDEKQFLKLDRWVCSRYVKVQIEAYTQNCTISVKARLQL